MVFSGSAPHDARRPWPLSRKRCKVEDEADPKDHDESYADGRARGCSPHCRLRRITVPAVFAQIPETPMLTLLLLLTLLALGAASPVMAQGPIPREEALSYTAHYWDGPRSISSATRQRVLVDPATIDLYARLINGEV